jgi:UDP-GlcNAc:undecaprenyl-phosphate GlcNAc-1-phosphate transferase
MHLFIPPFIALIVSLVLTPLVIALAKKQGWMVQPRKDRWHQQPTALMGGIGIFISFSLVFVFLKHDASQWNVFLGMVLMFLTGLVDDLRELKPAIKLVAQLLAAFIVLFSGYRFATDLFDFIAIPLTFFWIIGITNAVNLLDNMDGLAAGISTIVAIIAGVFGYINGDMDTALLSWVLAGASLGFLVYNFNPARIFMGDCGSLFLGFSLSFLGLSVQKNLGGTSSSILILLMPISLLAIPIMDTTLVSVQRLLSGRKLSQGGRDHSSHRLVAMGLSEKQAVLILYALSIGWGLLCLLTRHVEYDILLFIIILAGVFSAFFAMILARVKVYNESEEKLAYLRSRGKKEGDLFVVRFFLFNKKLILGICTDILITFMAGIVAMNATGAGKDWPIYLPGLFICVKVGLFYMLNLYYRMWRYMAIKEMAGYLMAALLAELVLMAMVWYIAGFASLPLYFFLFDFLLTFTAVIASRLIYRFLLETFQSIGRHEQKVLIYGAGDRGYLLLKEIIQNKKYGFKPVGWIDDDPNKQGMLLAGLKVYGGSDRVADICRKTGASHVIVSTEAVQQDAYHQLKLHLSALDISLGRFMLHLHFD